ncbi:hypothetical protein P0D73_28710 [Paraburkholderia sp. RL18-101-BIB-B]|uniref:hypothetical protein n=1 Tax=Paraburkholderia sp. RL18-101-BIB-B TaxID=3031634 RepID=UPI0038BC1EA0
MNKTTIAPVILVLTLLSGHASAQFVLPGEEKPTNDGSTAIAAVRACLTKSASEQSECVWYATHDQKLTEADKAIIAEIERAGTEGYVHKPSGENPADCDGASDSEVVDCVTHATASGDPYSYERQNSAAQIAFAATVATFLAVVAPTAECGPLTCPWEYDTRYLSRGWWHYRRAGYYGHWHK